ncbi:MAG: hypothetical protein IJ849_11705 [Selenomonadaceae bacterium]|nr:hypothetical protein [Selenomonadaceae bacterium]
MRYRGLDENGDYRLGNQNAYIEGAEAVRQACVTRLRQLIYEWWEKLEDGVPYWQKIIATRDVGEAIRQIRRRIELTKEVVTILYFDHNWDNEKRILTFRAVVQSIYGEFELEEAYE